MARALLLDLVLNDGEAEQRQQQHLRVKRRQFRSEALTLVAAMSNESFKAHYRLTKEQFCILCEDLEPLAQEFGSDSISFEIKVLTTLSFYATGSYQKPIGMSFLHALTQPGVSRVVEKITNLLNNQEILKKYIRFPQNRSDRERLSQGFFEKFHFPGIIGCVDGTHVALLRPSDHEDRFYNRKHYHSRNVQIVCDSDLNILNVDATYGGASHDAFIWRNSEINDHMQDLFRNGESVWLLGDSGYPLRPWLLTPIVNAQVGSPEDHYTTVHCKTRNVVERCIGVLKARWRCLLSHRVLHYSHEKAAKIINACCVLHNLANAARLQAHAVTERPVVSVTFDHRSLQEIETAGLDEGRQVRSDVVEYLWHFHQ